MPATATRRSRPAQRTRTRSRKRTITPEDLQRVIFIAEPRISPDGSCIAFIRKHIGEKNEYVTNLWLVDTDGATPARQFTSGGRDRQPRWSPDGAQLAFIAARDKHKPQVHLINTDGGESRALTSFPEGSIGSIKWSPDGSCLAVSFREQSPERTQEAQKQRRENGRSDPPQVVDHWWYRLDGDGYFIAQRYHLYLVDAKTGTHRQVYDKDTLGDFTFDFSPDGSKLVVSSNRDKRAGLKAWNDELLLVDVRSGRIKPIPDLPRGPKNSPIWSPDGKYLAYLGREGDDGVYSTENLEVWLCDPARGGAKSLTGREDYCLMAVAISDTAEVSFGGAIHWSADSKRIYMQIGWHGETHLASVKRTGGAIMFHTHGRIMHHVGNIARSTQRMAMMIGSATKPEEVHVAELGADSATTTRLTSFNDALLKELTLSTPRQYWVTTSDGTKVHTWVLMPPNTKKKRRHPAVLEIHGGPHGQYGVGFFHEFQVLAAQGYVVVYSNPRGSKGYGRDHCHAIRGAWGTADWTDIQAVIEFMKAHDAIDPKRMGVMGGSYGGYMTNWVISHCRDFAGAITDRCVSNLVSMAGSSDYMEVPDLYFPGAPWDRPEQLWESSPIKHFKGVKTPTLIIHSEGDLRCNVEQAEQVHAALCVQNVPTRLVRYPRSTSHGMSRNGPPDMRLHRLHQILDWWKRYLK